MVTITIMKSSQSEQHEKKESEKTWDNETISIQSTYLLYHLHSPSPSTSIEIIARVELNEGEEGAKEKERSLLWNTTKTMTMTTIMRGVKSTSKSSTTQSDGHKELPT